MYILAWPGSALAITVIAWLVNRIASRPKPPMTPEESMQAHQRFLQVLESSTPAQPGQAQPDLRRTRRP